MVTSTVGIVLVALLVLGIPFAIVLDGVARDAVRTRLDRRMASLSNAVAHEVARREPVEASELELLMAPEDHLVVGVPGGRFITVGEPIEGGVIRITNDLEEGVTLSLSTSDRAVRARIQRSVAALVGVGGLTVALSVGLALLQARRLAAPLDDLAATARRLGGGDFTAVPPRSGISEIDALADALDASRLRIAALLAAERQFSSNASHQLRSALTGLRLRLEELVTIGEGQLRIEAVEALNQADRLNDVVDDLLRLARTGRAGERRTIDVAALARQHVDDWAPSVRAARRRIVVAGDEQLAATATPGAIAQIIDVLISNALRHGAGTIRVSMAVDATRACLEVSDEGRGVELDAGELFARREDAAGHGIGLSLARSLAEADGGRLELAGSAPPTFRLSLPLPERAGSPV